MKEHRGWRWAPEGSTTRTPGACGQPGAPKCLHPPASPSPARPSVFPPVSAPQPRRTARPPGVPPLPKKGGARAAPRAREGRPRPPGAPSGHGGCGAGGPRRARCGVWGGRRGPGDPGAGQRGRGEPLPGRKGRFTAGEGAALESRWSPPCPWSRLLEEKGAGGGAGGVNGRQSRLPRAAPCRAEPCCRPAAAPRGCRKTLRAGRAGAAGSLRAGDPERRLRGALCCGILWGEWLGSKSKGAVSLFEGCV